MAAALSCLFLDNGTRVSVLSKPGEFGVDNAMFRIAWHNSGGLDFVVSRSAKIAYKTNTIRHLAAFGVFEAGTS